MKKQVLFLGPAMVLALAMAAGVICVPGWAQKGKPQPPPANPAIVFTAEKGWASTNLVVMDADGSNQKVIVNGTSGARFGNHSPQWALDGSRIAFGRNTGNDPTPSSISLVRKDGTGLCTVTTMRQTPDISFGYPVWSPDGSRLMYSDTPSSPQGSILQIVDAVCGANPIDVVHPYHDLIFMLSWSPDGTMLAAQLSDEVGNRTFVIFDVVYNADGTCQASPRVDLTSTGTLKDATIWGADWSSDSSRLAVGARIPNVDTYEIWVVSIADPFNAVNITNTLGVPEIQPSWSPLNDQIVYVRSDFIYKMNADGSNPVRLASPGKNMVLREPDWKRNP
jgi:hypothetical protein